MVLRRAVLWSLCGFFSSVLCGCGAGPLNSGPNAINNSRYSGSVHGGQQPVVGARVQLYTVGTTGDGSAATPLLTATVTSDSSGRFSLTGLYSCSSATQVYLVATGGNPGLSTANSNIRLMAALGPCSSLTPSTFIDINELTTVAAMAALAPYTSSPTAIGSSASDAPALAAAFALANQLVDTSTGVSPGANLPSNLTVPVAQLNTLADIAATCINSAGGTAGDGSPCGVLFQLTTVGANPAPTDTISALRNLALNPTLNTGGLFALASATAPFQPSLTTAPPDLRIRLVPASPASYLLQITPGSLTFPGTAVGFSSAPQTITITNSGSASVTSGSVATVGASAVEFAVSSNTCTSTLAAGASCTLQVTATPSANGGRSAYLSIGSSSPDSPQYVALSVTGTAPSAGPVSLTPSVSYTPSLSYNTGGVFQDLTLSNLGTSPLTIKSITEAGTDSPTRTDIPANFIGNAFALGGNTCGSMLPGKSSCTISVRAFIFTTYAGQPVQHTGTITVVDDAAAGPQVASLQVANSQMIAQEEGPGDSATISFPADQVGSHHTASAQFRSTSGYVQVPETYFAVGGSNPQDFSLSVTTEPYSPQTFPTRCASGSGALTCELNVTFTPTVVGDRSAKLYIVDGPSSTSFTGSNGQYILLTGSALAPGPALRLDQTEVSLQSYLPLTPDPASTGPTGITVHNTGSTTLSLTASFSGAASPFLAANVSACAALAPQATCTVTITMSATSLGGSTATVLLRDTSSGVSVSVPVYTTTDYWDPNASPFAYIFGSQTVGTSSAPQTITIGDLNGYPLGHAITAALSPTSNFTLLQNSCPASTTQLCTLVVAFTPHTAGRFTEGVSYTDTVSGKTNIASVTGTATAPGP